VKRDGRRESTLRNRVLFLPKKQGTLSLMDILFQHRPTVKRVMVKRLTVTPASLTVRYESARLSAVSPPPSHRAACYSGTSGCTGCTWEGGCIPGCVYQEGYQAMYTRKGTRLCTPGGVPGYVHQEGYQAMYTR